MAKSEFNRLFGKKKESPGKENPFTKQKEEEKKSQKQQYKSVRIYPEDFKEFKNLAFYQDKKIVEVISESLLLYKMKYEESLEEDNENEAE